MEKPSLCIYGYSDNVPEYVYQNDHKVNVNIAFTYDEAEDGIRDHCVTGVQTCALPISSMSARHILGLEKVPRVGLFAH